MNTLTTHIEIPTLGPGEIEVEVDYTTDGELLVHDANAVIGADRLPCWHLLSAMTRARIEEECTVDYRDRMESAVVSNGEFRDGD